MSKKKKIIRNILIIIAAVFVVFSIASFVIVKINFDDIFGRTTLTPSEYTGYLRYEDVKDEYDRELLSFESGENTLQGYLYGTDNDKGLVIVCHGLGGGAESYLTETLYFVDSGYQVFAYDNTGCYESEGKNCVGLVQSVIDLDAALTFIEGEERFSELPVLLYGHSWGAYAVTSIFNYDHDITASVSVAGFNDPMTMIMEWGENMMGGFIHVERPYIYIYQRMTFGDKLALTAVDGINNTDTPVLIIHGINDETIGFNSAGTIAYKDEITNPNVQYKICDKPKQDDHNNLFTDIEAIEYIDEQNKIYEEIWEKYDGEIPDDVRKEFYANVDKDKVNVLDEEFMQDVLNFYDEAINK